MRYLKASTLLRGAANAGDGCLTAALQALATLATCNQPSDLVNRSFRAAEVEAALRCAQKRLHGAVTSKVLAREMQPAQTVAGDVVAGVPRGLTRALRALVILGRVRRVLPLGTLRAGSAYYATADCAAIVAPSCLTDRDWQAGTIVSYVNSQRVRRFTTRALVRFAKAQQDYSSRCIRHKQWWTIGLDALSREGFIRATCRDQTGHVTWELVNSHTSGVTDVGSVHVRGAVRTAEGARPVSSGHAQEMDTVCARELIRRAKSRAAAECFDTSMSRVAGARPQRLDAIWASRLDVPGSAPRSKKALLDALTTRRTREPRAPVPGVARVVGIVGNRAYYDIATTDLGERFVQFFGALAAANTPHLGNAVEELKRAAACSRSGMIPLPATLLHARAMHLCGAVSSVHARLRVAHAAARAHGELFDSEEAAAVATTASLFDALVWVDAALAEFGGPPERAWAAHSRCEDEGIGLNEAWRALQGIADFGVLRASELPSRLRLVPVWNVTREEAAFAARKTDGGAGEMQRGRIGAARLDRVALICYICMRAGGPKWAAYAARGYHALGTLRDPTPIGRALLDGTLAHTHVSLAPALALLGDRESRAVLVRYLSLALRPRSDGDESEISIPAAEAAAFGLGPLPLGRTLASLEAEEEEALLAAAEQGRDPMLRATASQSLQAWTEEWPARRVLNR